MSNATVTSRGNGEPTVSSVVDMGRVKDAFPILSRRVNGKRLVYLDNAATGQKPRAVIEAVRDFYATDNANVHRGVHYLSEHATVAYEGVRERARRFVNAREAREIVFVRGTTEAINLVAQSFGRGKIGVGDEIVVSAMEHHSNIVPWQILCQERNADLRVIPMTRSGELILDRYRDAISPRTKLVAVVHVSNALGTVNPVEEMIGVAHERSIPVLVDGAQAAPHMPVDVQALGADFYTISGHKMFGPTGVGFLYGRAELLEAMPPYQGGGDMIRSVSFAGTTYAPIPSKFEAGTPNVAGVIGLGAAMDYLESVGWDNISKHEADVLAYATERLSQVPGVELIGTAEHKAGVVSFVVNDVHAHDVGTVVDQEGVAIRTGHHCAQPVMEFYGVTATARASFALYNTRDDVDALVRALARVREVFG